MTQKFGINDKTQSSEKVRIPAPQKEYDGEGKATGKYTFPIAQLKTVEKVILESDNGSKYVAIGFNFVDKLQRQHQENIIIDAEDTKVDKTGKTKLEVFNIKIKHIYTEFAPMPKEGIGIGAEDAESYIEAIVESFNTGNEGNAIYENKDVFLKLIYNTKGYLSFPYAPNFIQLANKPCQLDISKYDINKLQVQEIPTTGSVTGKSAW